MKYYKIVSSYTYESHDKYTGTKKRTKRYTFFFRGDHGYLEQLKYELSLGAKCTIEEVSEAAYVKGKRTN